MGKYPISGALPKWSRMTCCMTCSSECKAVGNVAYCSNGFSAASPPRVGHVYPLGAGPAWEGPVYSFGAASGLQVVVGYQEIEDALLLYPFFKPATSVLHFAFRVYHLDEFPVDWVQWPQLVVEQPLQLTDHLDPHVSHPLSRCPILTPNDGIATVCSTFHRTDQFQIQSLKGLHSQRVLKGDFLIELTELPNPRTLQSPNFFMSFFAAMDMWGELLQNRISAKLKSVVSYKISRPFRHIHLLASVKAPHSPVQAFTGLLYSSPHHIHRLVLQFHLASARPFTVNCHSGVFLAVLNMEIKLCLK